MVSESGNGHTYRFSFRHEDCVYSQNELGSGALLLMRRLKNLLDPHGILNPGKVLFDEVEEPGRSKL